MLPAPVNSQRRSFALRLYEVLLRLYPARFREEYSGPMMQDFLAEYRDASGAFARAWLITRSAGDLTLSIPKELAREVAQDLRFSLRVYRQRKFATFTAFAALALAIGITTGVFSVINALMLRSLPFTEPERLVEIQSYQNVYTQDPNAWAAKTGYLESASQYSPYEMTLIDGGKGAHVIVAQVQANFFDVAGTSITHGRAFSPEEGTLGKDDVAILSNSFWQQSMGADLSVLGRTVSLSGAFVRVIGIAPPGFDFPSRSQVWTTFRKLPTPSGAITAGLVARLRPGVAFQGAQAGFLADVRRAWGKGADTAPRSSITPLRDKLAGPVRDASFVLLALVTLVLLIACANVAQLMLSRARQREQELALRLALGASRARILQQLVTEAIVLTSLSAMAGLGIARAVAKLADTVRPVGQLASQEYAALDWRVVACAMILAVSTGLLFGVLPGFSALRLQSNRVTGQRMRSTLITVQAALTLVLLGGSVTLGRSFLTLMSTDLGFNRSNVVTMNISMVGLKEDAERDYSARALHALRELPGVTAAGAVRYSPLVPGYLIGGRYLLDTGETINGFVARNIATPGYFDAMGTPILAGRDFSEADLASSEKVVIVSQEFARKINVGNLAGRTLVSQPGTDFAENYRIVGVVGDLWMRGPQQGASAMLFLPFAQAGAGFMTLAARVRDDPATHIAQMRDALRAIHPEIPVIDIKTLDQRLAETLAQPRFYTQAILFLAGFALLLAAVGVYGAASQSVAQRTREIGIRIAVGGTQAGIRGLLIRQSLIPLAIGAVSGIAVILQAGNVLQALFAGVEPIGAGTCLTGAAVLLAAGLLAAWRATESVTSADPMTALRAD